MKLEYDENSDLVPECVPLDESLFKEIFNERIWKWYHDMGLIETAHLREFLHVVEGKLMFDADAKRLLTAKRGWLKSMFASFSFGSKAISSVESYDYEKLDEYYRRKSSEDFASKGRNYIISEFQHAWDILIENFRYSIIAGLIIQYDVKHITADKELLNDAVADKCNAMLDLNSGKISKSEFDSRYGFLAEYDYDFSCPRYAEMQRIRVPDGQRIAPKPGIHNIRENIKLRSAKLVALIRKMLLALHDEDVFYRYKDEIISGSHADVSSRRRKHEPPEQERKGDAQTILHGERYSGSGIIEAPVHVLMDIDAYESKYDGSIIVVETMHPDYTMIMSRVKAIVSERGGRLAHLAIVARERGFPLIGQVDDAISVLSKHTSVRLDVDGATLTILR